MASKKEEKIKTFFNERIKSRGDGEFTPEVGKTNFAGHAILDFLKNHIETKNKRILDAGCGEGRFSKYFIDMHADIVSMDFSEEYIRVNKKNMPKGKFIVGSVTKIPFPDDTFDYIFSVDVLQHVPELRASIQEFYRVLKKGGTLIIIDKNKTGLNPKILVPQILIQKYKELTELRYSEFKERWFIPEKFKRLIAQYFNDVKYTYLLEKNKNRIFKTFPKLNLFVAWIAKK
jgi:ubiquinone/menaquinone biosynthesis C-methylase UbiE